jgi:hypothetical protein
MSSQLYSEWLPGLNETANFVLPILLKTTPELSARIRKRDRDRAEHIRLAGGPKPSLRERAVALALEKGEVRTKDLTEIGVHRCYLARMCDEGLLVKVGYGRHRAAEPKAAWVWISLGQATDGGHRRMTYRGRGKGLFSHATFAFGVQR